MNNVLIPGSQVVDPSQIYDLDVNSDEFKDILVAIARAVNDISTCINTKDAAIYDTSEVVTGAQYYPATGSNLRGVLRKVINFGALPNAATKSVAHSISFNNSITMVRIYGTAKYGNLNIPIPYASPVLADNIELDIDNTNVNITTGKDYTNYDTCNVVLEFVKF